jgi:hypothetical protein
MDQVDPDDQRDSRRASLSPPGDGECKMEAGIEFLNPDADQSEIRRRNGNSNSISTRVRTGNAFFPLPPPSPAFRCFVFKLFQIFGFFLPLRATLRLRASRKLNLHVILAVATHVLIHQQLIRAEFLAPRSFSF